MNNGIQLLWFRNDFPQFSVHTPKHRQLTSPLPSSSPPAGWRGDLEAQEDYGLA